MNETAYNSKKQLRPSELILPGNWRKVQKHFKGGNDAQRESFINFKRKLTARALKPRLDIVAQSKKDEDWEIPRDMGFKILPPGTFPETDGLMQKARNRVENATPDEAETSKSQLMQHLLDKNSLSLESDHIQFGLREDILRAVTEYLGIAPVIEHIDIWHSFFHGKDEWDNSQLWHCDSIDTAQIKIFLYSNDVDEDSGPLTVLSAEASKRVRDAIDYQYVGESRVPDEVINKLVKPEEIHPIVGPAGTCVFVDTSRCFHYGSRVRASASSRIITLYQYLSPSAFIWPLNFRRKAPFKHLATKELSTLQRMALGAE